MKKLSVFIALILLAVAGTGYAITCAYDNVPGATLLVPYWRVSLNGVTTAPIPSGGIDTLVSVVNVSVPGLIAHVTVWNKYSRAVLDFNIPLTGKDVVSFSMRDIMNGKLNANLNTQFISTSPVHGDPCGVNITLGTYKPSVGFANTQFIRFSHPEAGVANSDAYTSVSVYTPDAFGAFRNRVWDSLDESGDITSFTSSSGDNILDFDNPACFGSSNGDGIFKTDLSGYLTIDVVNYCTNYFPENPQFYTEDAIATSGWGPTTTPNALIGDIFYIDTASQAGNISGDQAVAIEFASFLTFPNPAFKTFFGKFVSTAAVTLACAAEQTTGCASGFAANVPAAYRFPGDGRESLGEHYGFRYLSDQANGYQTWILVWRSDSYNDTDTSGTSTNGDPLDTPTNNLCHWLAAGGPKGSGLYDNDHVLVTEVYDNDENSFTGTGGPSGGAAPGSLYIFLESQRINLLNNAQFNPAGFKGGWAGFQFVNTGATFAYNTTRGRNWNQAWVGVQHTAPGAFLSVGHSASEITQTYNCIVGANLGLNSGITK